MKKFLLLIVTGIATLQFLNAQVIEIVGVGVHNVESSELIITSPGTVDKVVVVATALFEYDAEPGDVTFSNFIDPDVSATFVSADPILNAHVQQLINDGASHVGYYSTEFTDVSAGKVSLNSNGQQEYVKSFTAYVYRTGPSPGEYYDVQGGHVYAWLNGLNKAYDIDFTIPESDNARDVTVNVPFTDLMSNDPRPATIIIQAGVKSVTDDFITNTAGDLLSIDALTLADVPGDVTQVKVRLYSRLESDEYKQGGDSFVSGPVLLSTTYERDLGCTYTQGYWKTHADPSKKKYDPTWGDLPEKGPKTLFFKADQPYCTVLNTPVKGNAYYILAHQYIAAELNFLSGADDAEVIDVFNLATRFFNAFTPEQVENLTGDRAKYIHNLATGWAEILDDYNNGLIGPGHCDDKGNDEFEPEVATVNEEDAGKGKAKKGKNKNKSAQIVQGSIELNNLKVYPNPVINSATIFFNAVYDGKVTVDLYNSVGQHTKRLMDRSVNKDLPVMLSINGQEYHEGLYILRIQNESIVGTARIQIGR